jgi:hypothetical protein
MKTVLPIIGLVLLAGCNHAAPGADKAQAAAAPAGPHSNAAPGTYTHTDAKGSMITTFMADDKTYTDWVAGAMTERGKWAVENDKTCFHPENGKEYCQSDGPVSKDGSYTVTPDAGAPYTLSKSA